jgi:hypothetical protein
MLARSIVAALTLLAGCSDNKTTTMMMPTPDMARGPMDHPPLWRMMHLTAPVQVAPEVWTVVWQGDDAFGAEVVDFLDAMLKSDYWTSSLAEYGIGAGVSKGLIVLPMPAPAVIGDSQLSTLAAQLVANGQVTANDNTQVAFLPPPQTKVTAGGSTGCVDFLGYHSHGNNSASAVAYSVNLHCSDDGDEKLDDVTDTLSHEAAEAASDPVPRSGIVDDSPQQQEIADLCEFGQELPLDIPADATHPAARRYWVQRFYSDKRAADGTIDPCLPLAWDRPYWNVATDPSVITAAPNVTAPLDARLDVFAYGDVGLIKWSASSSGASVDPPGGEAHAGDTIPITVTLSSGLQSGDFVEIDIISESANGGSQLWFSYVQAR